MSHTIGIFGVGQESEQVFNGFVETVNLAFVAIHVPSACYIHLCLAYRSLKSGVCKYRQVMSPVCTVLRTFITIMERPSNLCS